MSLDQPAGFVKRPDATRDRFLGGRLVVAQPARGFRAGTDSVLLGAAVARDAARVLDLGAGAGVAALVALALDAGRTATLLESDAEMAALARENVLANGVAGRATVVEGDVARILDHVPGHGFDTVIANPPYFAEGSGTPARRRGAAARQMPAGALDAWVRAAAGAVAGGGEAVFILPAAGLAEGLAAFGPRFGGICVLPLLPRPDAAASRILLRGRAGSRAPLTLLAGRPLHMAGGRGFSEPFEAIFRHGAPLDW